ncbi:hypothetical protein [Undibacterium squillarum]|nr:hypothetical protein [Undibacterium squillarum]
MKTSDLIKSAISLAIVILLTYVIFDLGRDTKTVALTSAPSVTCSDGYLHSVTTSGDKHQITDDAGHGIKCKA